MTERKHGDRGKLTPLELEIVEMLLDERFRQRKTQAAVIAAGSLSKTTLSQVEIHARPVTLLFAEEYARVLGMRVKFEFVAIDEEP